MAQTLSSIISLGSRYSTNIQYRVLDNSGNYYPGPGDNLVNGNHLGNGIWKAIVTLPDNGGEVRWFLGTLLLGVDIFPPSIQTSTSSLNSQLSEVLDQLKADYVKSDTRFTRYRQGTQTIILDKNVSFDSEAGYTVTQR